MDFQAYSHGQIVSKLWLCETLEPYITYNSNICILGCWYNLLGQMLLVRNKNHYNFITGIDIDSVAIDIANKINIGFMLERKMNNCVADANIYDISGNNVVINTSPEHMDNDSWYNNIPQNTLVCLQTSNVDKNDDIWKITNPSRSLDEFIKKYPLSNTLYSDTLHIKYDDWGYERYMLIGFK